MDEWWLPMQKGCFKGNIEKLYSQPPKVAEYFQATVDGSGNLEKIFDIHMKNPLKKHNVYIYISIYTYIIFLYLEYQLVQSAFYLM